MANIIRQLINKIRLRLCYDEDKRFYRKVHFKAIVLKDVPPGETVVGVYK